ncbi:MAG: cyanophycin synthetase, partial [Candidatus Andersenbacteria bacterium]
EYISKMLDRAEQGGLNIYRLQKSDIDASHPALAGSINKENAGAVTLLARALHIPEEKIEAGIQQVKSVPGRMEVITAPQGFKIIIDYAVTPDALERLYSDAKKELKPENKILGTLSAAGLRDRGKRPDMARAVAKYADRIIVTREDPWTEPEEQIFQDLEEGLPPIALATGGSGLQWQRIVDRKQAIKTLLQEAKPGDIVILTGKGAERGMGIGEDVIPWNERELVEEILKNI